MKAIRKNMKDQILTNDKKILHCKMCDSEYSGNAGDYWDLPKNHTFKCCDTEMELVTKVIKTRYV